MKRVLSAFIFFMIAGVVSAQNVSIGPSIGVSHSWITGTENVVFKPGVSVGATVIYSPAEHWGLGGDIRASFLEGVRTKSTVLGADYESKLNAAYLRVPLKVSYFFGQHGDRMRPKIFAGPSFGFLLGGNYQVNEGTKTKAKDILEAFDFGIVAGAGLNYRIMKYTWLNVDLAYNNGLLDATKHEGSFNSNRNVALNVGLTFPLGTVKP